MQTYFIFTGSSCNVIGNHQFLSVLFYIGNSYGLSFQTRKNKQEGKEDYMDFHSKNQIGVGALFSKGAIKERDRNRAR